MEALILPPKVQPHTPEIAGVSLDRLSYVDGLRGVAAIGVAWFHVFTQNGGAELQAVVPTYVGVASAWGRFGVQLFFALSGFVLAYTLLRDVKMLSLRDVASYFLKRSMRLDPTYWAVLCVYFVLAPILMAFYAATGSSVALTLPSTISDYMGNVFYFLPFVGNSRVVPVVWTLALEVQLYIFFSLCLWLGYKLSRATACDPVRLTIRILTLVSLFGALWPLGIVPYADNWLWPHLNNFMLGVSICAFVSGLPGAYLLGTVTILAHAAGAILTHDSHTIAGLIAAALMLLSGRWGPLRQFLESGLLQRLGAWSYSIYLLHPIVGALTVELLRSNFGGSAAISLFYVGAGMAVTCGCAEVLWRTVERPSIGLSKRIIIGRRDSGK